MFPSLVELQFLLHPDVTTVNSSESQHIPRLSSLTPLTLVAHKTVPRQQLKKCLSKSTVRSDFNRHCDWREAVDTDHHAQRLRNPTNTSRAQRRILTYSETGAQRCGRPIKKRNKAIPPRIYIPLFFVCFCRKPQRDLSLPFYYHHLSCYRTQFYHARLWNTDIYIN